MHWQWRRLFVSPSADARTNTSDRLPPDRLRRQDTRSHDSTPEREQGTLPLSLQDGLEEIDDDKCTLEALNASAMAFHDTSRRFYAELQQLAPTLSALEVSRSHALLCNARLAPLRHWGNCLPLSARRDEPFCVGASRTDLLAPALVRRQVCYASVLHMILVDVYEELAAADASPVLLYGTLLGAVRNASIIPYTEDADLGFQHPVQHVAPPKMGAGAAAASAIETDVADALAHRGYHLFQYGIYRVCVAPSHPLASRLYDPHHSLGVEYAVPYVDLYRMTHDVSAREWAIEQTKLGWKVPDAQVQPFSRVTLLDRDFDTLADPVAFLQREYGAESYLVPENWSWAW